MTNQRRHDKESMREVLEVSRASPEWQTTRFPTLGGGCSLSQHEAQDSNPVTEAETDPRRSLLIDPEAYDASEQEFSPAWIKGPLHRETA